MPDAVINKRRPLREIGETTGVTHFCSWTRLEEMMRQAGQVRPSETVRRFVIEESGITICFD